MTSEGRTSARGFVLHEGVRNYFDFSNLRMFNSTRSPDVARGSLILFDAYYAGLMLGLATKRLGAAKDLEGSIFLPSYPNEFEAYREYIAGLLVDAEVTALHSEDYSESQLERAIAKLLQVASPTRLSPEGMHILNLYAAGGFELLRSKMGAKPSDPSNFMIRYQAVLEAEIRS
ncbi:hypothetical protein [Pseudaestuariivita atlantica]|uniref:hypothetical protein n=1 Tax=Pseudaestuariivita atlantica TaxID=1317121 RepID=UPI00106D429A|nr:hypothetical protein [Pseudaestuariivita atlantica]